jgi:hypothetical protein
MWRPLLYSLAIVSSCLAAAVGGFLAGRSGGPDLANAARGGSVAGTHDGARAGSAAGKLAGYRAGYQVGYHRGYARAYSTSYRDALGQ